MVAFSISPSPRTIPFYIISRQVSHCLNIAMGQSGSSSSPSSFFPFLRLPAEVRMQIYRHLIPDIPISTWLGSDRPFPLRRDGASCSPAILRTNRTIFKRSCKNGAVRCPIEPPLTNMAYISSAIIFHLAYNCHRLLD